MVGFSTWYYATSLDAALSIAQIGQTAKWSGADPHGLGSPYHVLFQRRQDAESWGAGAVVIVHVPDAERAEYLTCPGVPCYRDGTISGLIRPLPPSMIHPAEDA
jgi:hypothetical protein